MAAGSKMPCRAVSITGVDNVAPRSTNSPATATAIRRRKIRAPKTALTMLAASFRPTSMQSHTKNPRPEKGNIVIKSTGIFPFLKSDCFLAEGSHFPARMEMDMPFGFRWRGIPITVPSAGFRSTAYKVTGRNPSEVRLKK